MLDAVEKLSIVNLIMKIVDNSLVNSLSPFLAKIDTIFIFMNGWVRNFDVEGVDHLFEVFVDLGRRGS